MRSKPRTLSKWRFALVGSLLLLLLFVGVFRVFTLQIMESERGPNFLQHEGIKRSLGTLEIPAYRGVITDRHGESLAVSTPVISIFADPRILAKAESAVLSQLSDRLDFSLEHLKDKLARYHGKKFMYLARHLPPNLARSILVQNYPGVKEKKEYRRFYPAGAAVAHVVGITNLDGKGIEGIELAYDERLRGKVGIKHYIKNPRDEAVRDIGVVRAPRPGRNLRLSIDLRIQHVHFRELRRAMKLLEAESGSVITLDAKTGEVLAMVSEPGYNPNKRFDMPPNAIRNRVITDSYEPGSTMKPLALVAALESGLFSLDSIIDTTPGLIEVDGKVLRDERSYGEITLPKIIAKSSQVGVTKLALKIGGKSISDVFRRFGIGEPVNTGFPGENWGFLPRRSDWTRIEEANLAFGYGLKASPIQIAKAYTIFANGGFQTPISLLAIEPGDLYHSHKVMSHKTANQIIGVLRSATEEGGTGALAKIAGYSVAGKTGTVRKIGAAGYDRDAHMALFAGIVPADNPRFVTVVVIDKPKGNKYHGGTVAAPIFSKVAQATLRLLDIAPSREKSKLAAEPSFLGSRA